jgi:hypothetical protein
MEATSHTADPLSELHGQQVEFSLKKHAVMITEYLMVVENLSNYLKGASGLLLPSLVVKSQDLEHAKHQNRMPVSRAMSTTQDPKLTERRSLLQSGRRDSRPKLSTRKPDFLRECSMPSVMARGRRSLRAFKQSYMPNVNVTPARKPVSQRRERTSKSDSEHLKLRRRSSLNGVSEPTRKSDGEHLKLRRRSSLNGVSEQPSKSDGEHLKLRRRSSINGVSERTCKSESEHLKLKRRSSIGQTVTIAKFLEDNNRSRVKTCREEAADAKSTKAITCLPVHKLKVVSTTAHTTRRPVMPEKASRQQFRCAQ